MRLSPEDLAFRDDVRTFLTEELTEDLRRVGKRMTAVYAEPSVSLAWQRKLHARGWAAPSWPVAYGGCDWTPVQHYLFAAELLAAGAPPLSPMGLSMCGPVLIQYGTPEQQAYFLPRLLAGDDFWCQGYSEPGSGSDLASLQMKAVDEGDHFRCTGTKIWTTHAHVANWMFCLVRTDNSGKPQQGITFLLVDMTSPGVSVDPIHSLSLEHIQNTVHFEDVRVPKDHVVGAINDGWSVAKYLLEFERGGAYSPMLRHALGRIDAIARQEADGTGGRLIDDPDFARKLAQAEIQVSALEMAELRIVSALSQGQNPGLDASRLKVQNTEMSQHLTELAIEAVGHYVQPFQPQYTAPGGPIQGFGETFPLAPLPNEAPVGPEHAVTVMPKYLNDRAGSIYGGSNEIQRNIMAKAILGL